MVSAQAVGDVSNLLLILTPGLSDGQLSWYGATSSD